MNCSSYFQYTVINKLHGFLSTICFFFYCIHGLGDIKNTSRDLHTELKNNDVIIYTICTVSINVTVCILNIEILIVI